MPTAYKKITQLTLKSGDKVQVTLAEGASVRQAKSRTTSSSIIFPSLNNRMIDSNFIVDVEDKMIEDRQTTLVQTKSDRLLDIQEPQKASPTSPGYLNFIESRDKLRAKLGLRKLSK